MTAGQNAKAFVGGSFTPSGTASGTFKARTTSFTPVKTARQSSTTIWSGYAGAPTIGSASNTVIGNVPNKTNSISVSWTHGGSPVLDGFNVYVKTTGGWSLANSGLISSTARSYTYGAISPDTTYTFKVEAVSKSDIAQETSGTTNISLASPSAPTPSASTVTTTSVSWSWPAPGTDYQEFAIRTSSDNSNWSSASYVGLNTTHQITGLSENVTRYIQVAGRNYNNHWSGWSSSVSAKCSNAAPPAPGASISSSSANSADLKTSSGDVRRTISWSANNAADTEFKKFEVYLRADSDAWPTTPNYSYTTSGSRSGSFTGYPSTKYWIKVVQYDTYDATSEISTSITSPGVETTTVYGYTNVAMTSYVSGTYDGSNTSASSALSWAFDNNGSTLWYTTDFGTTNPSPRPWLRNTLLVGDPPAGTVWTSARLTNVRVNTRVTHQIAIGVYADGYFRAWDGSESLVGGGNYDMWFRSAVSFSNVDVGHWNGSETVYPTWGGGNADIYIVFTQLGSWKVGTTNYNNRASMYDVTFDWDKTYRTPYARYY